EAVKAAGETQMRDAFAISDKQERTSAVSAARTAIVEALTDNRNRTGGAVRAVFTKHGGNLGATGAVSHMFSRVGEIILPASVGSAEDVLEAAIEAGAEDVQSSDEQHVVTCAFEDLGSVSSDLEGALGEPESVKAIWQPSLTTPVDEDGAQSVMKLIAALEDDDDVQNVYTNFDVDDETLAKLTAA
ncbi:MAG: YebC/PmpR family DNA-binding transcriptional regulator, partial [Pseudomonadota bacterium]